MSREPESQNAYTWSASETQSRLTDGESTEAPVDLRAILRIGGGVGERTGRQRLQQPCAGCCRAFDERSTSLAASVRIHVPAEPEVATTAAYIAMAVVMPIGRDYALPASCRR